MINRMSSFSDSFSKLVLKLGEVKRTTEKRSNIEDTDIPLDNVNHTSERSRSPFVMLLSEGDEEFSFNLRSDSLIEEALEANEASDLSDNHPLCCSLKVDLSNDDISSENISSVESWPTSPVQMDKVRSYRNKPLSKEKFQNMFDESGRLVNEHDLRKAIFKGGVEEVIRKEVWVFLFELYPFNTTARERDILAVENAVRYEAMKIRWKTLLKGLVSDYEGVHYCPKWYTGCPENANEYTELPNVIEASLTSNNTEVCPEIIEEFDLSCKNENKSMRYSQLITDNLPYSSNGAISSYPGTVGCSLSVSFPSTIQELSPNNNYLNNYEPSCEKMIKETEFIPQVEFMENLNSDDISKALADAMFEYCEPSEKNLSVELSTLSKLDSFNLLSEDVLSLNETKTCEQMTSAVRTSGSFDIIDTSVNEVRTFEPIEKLSTFQDCVCSQTEQSKYSVSTTNDFVNTSSFIDPFEDTLLLNSKNMQESLYSKSENFKSIDLSDLPSLSSSSIIPDEVENSFLQESDYILNKKDNSKNEYHNSLLPSGRSVFISELYDESKLDKKISSKAIKTYNDSIFQPICSTKDVDSICCNLNKDSLKNLDTSSISNNYLHNNDSFENNFDLDSINGDNPSFLDLRHFSDSLEVNELNEIPVKFTETEQDCIKSPTGETLDKLPPWIAQMIKASTPPQPLTKPARSRSLVPTEMHKKRLTRSNSFDNDSTLPVKAVNYDKNLLGIVENANKYLLEQMHLHTEKVSSVSLPPVVAEQSLLKEPARKSDMPAMGILSAFQNDDSFLVDAPKFQFILSSTDSVYSVEKLANPDLNTCPYCDFDPVHPPKIFLPSSTVLGEEQLKFIEIQAQVFAARQPYNEKMISASVRVIDKDVPRTDRELPLFKDDSNPGLVKLRDSLLTYAFFHPEVGYAQGMNDIMSRFLFVMDTEAEAYWMFVNYMEHFKKDFMEEGMLRKISLLEQLLMKMDRELFDVLQSTDMGLMFCHRWLLLNFKREFDYKEALRLFEITSSRHLEVSSLEAEMERYKERAKEFENNSAGTHQEEIYLSPEYPFDIFVCVAMLMECRSLIMDTVNDICAIYHILSKLPTTLDLSKVLQRSEELFYQYCRKTVVDCFQVIDELEVKDFKRNKFSFR